MQRRIFVAGAIAGAVGAAGLPRAAEADTPDPWTNVLFSADATGHWGGMERLHVPEVDVADGTLTVHTPHPMSQGHYIVSHTVVLDGGRFLDRRTFAWTDQPLSTHTLPPGYKGRVIVTSTCNQHDWWVKELSV